MRWIIMALLLGSGPAWAADDDDESPPGISSAKLEASLRARAYGERVAATVLIPTGSLLNAGGIVAMVLGGVMFSGLAQCTFNCNPGLAWAVFGGGVAMFVVGIATATMGGIWAASSRNHRKRANPWLAGIQF